MKFKFTRFSNFKDLIILVFAWRAILFIVSFLASVIVFKNTYPFPYADTILIQSGLPKWIWGFANFDGVHYIRNAMWGYNSEFSQAFFPLYPLLMRYLGLWGIGFFEPRAVYLLTGLLISFFSFLTGLYFYQKVVESEFSKEIAKKSILLLIAFPTAFYFASVYSESLFFLLCCMSIYLIIKKRFLYASIVIALASATRVNGVLLAGILLYEIIYEVQKGKFRQSISDLFNYFFSLLISVSGLLLYMFYLFFNYNNPLYFLTSQPLFGAARQVDRLVLLPQVLFRYLKILLTVPANSAQFFSAGLELLFTLFGIFLLIISFRKIRMSFWLFSLATFLLPTFTGTLLSMPRFLLILFLTFPALVVLLKNRFRYLLVGFFILEIIFTFLFTAGYWIA